MARVVTILALLLISSVAANAVSAVAFATTAQGQEQPPGCHGHGPQQPRPVNKKCCQAGHNVAVVQVNFSVQPRSVDFETFRVHSFYLPIVWVSSKAVNLSSASPPGPIALRI
jgi:hypothetical protein